MLGECSEIRVCRTAISFVAKLYHGLMAINQLPICVRRPR
jgi:hypothetical protein